MKLQNKKTGEIIELVGEFKRSVDKPDFTLDTYETLAELNEDWEDYEEPKEIVDVRQSTADRAAVYIEMANEEEAEKAVEKLKVWKRLKYKGFKFNGWFDGNISIMIDTNIKFSQVTDEIIKDFNFLFRD